MPAPGGQSQSPTLPGVRLGEGCWLHSRFLSKPPSLRKARADPPWPGWLRPRLQHSSARPRKPQISAQPTASGLVHMCVTGSGVGHGVLPGGQRVHPTSPPWELGKSFIKQESAAKAQRGARWAGVGQRVCQQLEALRWPGLQGRASRAWPVLCMFMQVALRPHSSPGPSMSGGGCQGKLSGTGPRAPYSSQPVERPAPRPQHKVVLGPGCPDNWVGLPEAWCVYGKTSDRSSPLLPLIVTVPSLQGKQAWVNCLHQALSTLMAQPHLSYL